MFSVNIFRKEKCVMIFLSRNSSMKYKLCIATYNEGNEAYISFKNA